MPDKHSASFPSRLAPEFRFPPYSYVPGRNPHPIADPAGHSFGQALPAVSCPQAKRWSDSREFCFAVDLFNHGYYWEAHEAWESLWHACGREGTTADFLKALIKLAAAGVKAREGRPDGWRRHLARACELLAQTRIRVASATEARYFGLRLDELIALAEKAREDGPPAGSTEDVARLIVMPFQLIPR